MIRNCLFIIDLVYFFPSLCARSQIIIAREISKFPVEGVRGGGQREGGGRKGWVWEADKGGRGNWGRSKGRHRLRKEEKSARKRNWKEEGREENRRGERGNGVKRGGAMGQNGGGCVCGGC